MLKKTRRNREEMGLSLVCNTIIYQAIKEEHEEHNYFTDKTSITKMIEEYIEYYNNKRFQRNLGVRTPMEKHEMYLLVA